MSTDELRKQIEKQTYEYLARGGKITDIESQVQQSHKNRASVGGSHELGINR